MPDYTVEIELPNHKSGDVWVGISSIGPVLIDDATPAEGLARVRMTLKKGNTVYSLDSDVAQTPDAPITISNPTTWEVTVPEVDGGFIEECGEWRWDMAFWKAGYTAPYTLYKGKLIVLQDV